MELGLRGRAAVITGASKGIGKAVARGLAAEGVNVALIARGTDLLDRAAAEIAKESGVKVLSIGADTTKLDTLQAAADTVRKAFGSVHIVVNNAGRPIRRTDRQIQWPDAEWVDDLDQKVVGMLRTIQTFLPLMPSDGTGRIINISGIAALTAWGAALTHGMNNAAMNQATGYLAADLAEQHITVNSVIPGLVATEGKEAWADDLAKQQNVTREEFLAGFCKRVGILAGRWATVDEVADTVVFIASDRGRYYNGAKIVLDGGLTVNARSV